jgi:hypothetical protein
MERHKKNIALNVIRGYSSLIDTKGSDRLQGVRGGGGVHCVVI